MDNQREQVQCNLYMKLHSRKLRDAGALKAEKRTMRLMGFHEPRHVAEWVNRNLIDTLNQKPSAVVRRITKVAEMLREAARLSEDLRLLDSENARTRCDRKLSRVMSELNASIYPYTAHPRVFAYMSRTGPALIAWYMCGARSDEEAREKRAIQFLVEHIELIGRIRRCQECRAWFFAVTDHQKYCGDKCRVRHASHSEGFKAKRARYMRETYRPAQKEQDLKAKKLARESKGR